MREITLPIEAPKIKINGDMYDLKMSDIEIYNRSQQLFVKCQKYADKPASDFDTSEILADLSELTGFIDEMLGEGATRRISHGRPVRMALALGWIGAIAGEAAAHYAELVTSEE